MFSAENSMNSRFSRLIEACLWMIVNLFHIYVSLLYFQHFMQSSLLNFELFSRLKSATSGRTRRGLEQMLLVNLPAFLIADAGFAPKIGVDLIPPFPGVGKLPLKAGKHRFIYFPVK